MFITFFIVGGRQRGNEMRISRTDLFTGYSQQLGLVEAGVRNPRAETRSAQRKTSNWAWLKQACATGLACRPERFYQHSALMAVHPRGNHGFVQSNSCRS
jgi:hypothetical protein